MSAGQVKVAIRGRARKKCRLWWGEKVWKRISAGWVKVMIREEVRKRKSAGKMKVIRGEEVRKKKSPVRMKIRNRMLKEVRKKR
jgi:hypothetical protein